MKERIGEIQAPRVGDWIYKLGLRCYKWLGMNRERGVRAVWEMLIDVWMRNHVPKGIKKIGRGVYVGKILGRFHICKI